MKHWKRTAALALMFSAVIVAADRVKTNTGLLEGTASADGKIRTFKGIPFAAPPVGDLRWKAPQPAASWTGVRKATEFGARCMQPSIYADMIFRDKGISEDCLYLNVWTPATSAKAKLPVMVWIYGGGFGAGAASEPRQDGENLAKKGVVVVSMNYRLGIFGFFSHPELQKESGHNSAGNYGLMDQSAALKWVKENITAFGGDPGNVTLFGESAGSMSVSAQMASPLSQGLFQKAIGESGGFFSRTISPKSVTETAEAGAKFGTSMGADSLAALRAIPAADLMQAAGKPGRPRFWPNVDGYFLPETASEIYAAGKQSQVPLLAGWNRDEGGAGAYFKGAKPTLENFKSRAQVLFGEHAEEFLKAYAATSDEEAKRAAQDYAGDDFIAFSTWKWIELQRQTGHSPVYRYQFNQAPPVAAPKTPSANPREPTAYHSAEIEFVFHNLERKDLPWRPEDHKISDEMSSYWVNFARSGDPNGPDLPKWPPYTEAAGFPVMQIGVDLQAVPDKHRDRYEFLERTGSPK